MSPPHSQSPAPPKPNISFELIRLSTLPIVGEDGYKIIEALFQNALVELDDVYRGCCKHSATSSSRDVWPVCVATSECDAGDRVGMERCKFLPYIIIEEEKKKEAEEENKMEEEVTVLDAKEANPPQEAHENGFHTENNTPNRTSKRRKAGAASLIAKPKKRKGGGRRKGVAADAPPPCSCHFNPHCLVSLGGVVTEIIRQQNKLLKKRDDMNETKKEAEFVDVDNSVEMTDQDSEMIVFNSKTNDKNSVDRPPPLSIIDIAMHVLPAPREASPSFNEELTLRKSITIPKATIESYLSSMILPKPTAAVISKQISFIKTFHSSLLHKSVISVVENSDTTLHLSLPPGLSNLGATCYLNSQLQCLAQNPSFLRGLLSWTPPQESNYQRPSSLTNVLQTLQSLLAEMTYGGSFSLCTQNFASSLGLMEDEMQDPNEFARLLFDRMNESFRAIPLLKNLLPEIFQGRVTYTTECKECTYKSLREEEFMDLTFSLPTTPGKEKVTLEQCLQLYLQPELLEEDNQYYCIKCKSKQDAARSISFSSTPPILNILLARYVFIPKLNIKKKVTSDIRLPKTFQIDQKEYVLCGVLNHLGKSAYGGHYIAEVMDWRTGLWFRFNDEDVSLVPNGLNYVYNGDVGGKKGSADAYNMFYVERQYLSDFILNEVNACSGVWKEIEGNDVVERIVKKRVEKYTLVSEIHARNLANQQILKTRQNSIIQTLFPSLLQSNPIVDISQFTSAKNDTLRWVNGESLRNFISCTNVTVTHTSPGNPICSHKLGLHPRMARKGKLITNDLYQKYMSLQTLERGKETAELPKITPEKNMHCTTCAGSYREELRVKISTFSTLLELILDLDPKKQKKQKVEGAEVEYLLSKKFVTELRNYAIKKVKEAATLGNIQMEGLDCLDLHEITSRKEDTTLDNGSGEKKDDCTTLDADEESYSLSQRSAASVIDLDHQVNSRITCSHGHCTVNSRNITRTVPQSVWNKITSIFPNAIHLPIKTGETYPSKCPFCSKELSQQNAYLEQMLAWGSTTLSNPQCLTLLKRRAEEETNDVIVTKEMRLVPKEVLDAWRTVVTEFSKKKIKSTFSMEMVEDWESKWEHWTSNNSCGHLLCQNHNLSLPLPSDLEILLNGTKQLNSQKFSEKEGGILAMLKPPLTGRLAFMETELLSLPEYESFILSMNEWRDTIRTKQDNGSNADGVEVSHTVHTALVEGSTEDHIISNIRITGLESNEYDVSPIFCQDKNCLLLHRHRLEEYKHKHKIEDSKKVSNVDNSSHETSEEETFDLTVNIQEFAKTENLETIASAELASISTLTEGNVRRSGRKRKTRTSTRDSYQFQMNKNDTLAKLRMLLYEKHHKSPLYQDLVLFANLGVTAQTKPLLLPLPVVYNPKMIVDIIQDVGASPNVCLDNDGENEITIYMQYTDGEDNQSKGKKRISMNRAEKESLENSIIESLMESISDTDAVLGDFKLSKRSKQKISSHDNSSSGKKGSRRRGGERGFQGTLLQSSTNPSYPKDIHSNEKEVNGKSDWDDIPRDTTGEGSNSCPIIVLENSSFTGKPPGPKHPNNSDNNERDNHSISDDSVRSNDVLYSANAVFKSAHKEEAINTIFETMAGSKCMDVTDISTQDRSNFSTPATKSSSKQRSTSSHGKTNQTLTSLENDVDSALFEQLRDSFNHMKGRYPQNNECLDAINWARREGNEKDVFTKALRMMTDSAAGNIVTLETKQGKNGQPPVCQKGDKVNADPSCGTKITLDEGGVNSTIQLLSEDDSTVTKSICENQINTPTKSPSESPTTSFTTKGSIPRHTRKSLLQQLKDLALLSSKNLSQSHLDKAITQAWDDSQNVGENSKSREQFVVDGAIALLLSKK